ncbi:GGDEF domain-containing protein [Usitatibacter palustris]|uniref:diguanylate cyclase n=1 Tax=Usitatibacter palustris TaxID=2732487 RepID=A0A6M4H836_9PROT|nr:GGDEF domain-containing protein [Usitatibacter palustris]QJR14863.1 hypothetical protein DSM104440_01678 [Usitatibacter palustris]
MSESTVIVRRPPVGPMGKLIRIAIATVTIALVFASSMNAALGLRDIAILYALGAPLGVSAWGFARVGHHEAAVVLLSLVLTTVTTLTLYMSPFGVHDVAVVTYSGVLLFNALLLSRPHFLSMAAIVLLVGTMVFVLDAMGLTESKLPGSWKPLLDFVLITGVVGGLARTVAEILYGSLGDAQQHAIKDPVTGVSNRQRFMGQAQARIRAMPADEFGVLALVDIDNFRRINHVVGHTAADRILAEVARRAQTVLPGVLVGRVGDDEIAVLALGMERLTEVESFVHRLHATLCFEHMGVSLTTTLGKALVPSEGKGIDALMMVADAALTQNRGGSNSRPVTGAR